MKQTVSIGIIIYSFLFFCLSLAAEEYKIQSVEYKITGRTTKYALSNAVPIDTHRIFPNFETFEAYLIDLHTQLSNQRVLETVLISPAYGSADENSLIPVDLLITTKDTWNILPLPYPKYDSNTGFTFKIKIKDYNFLGNMLPLNGEVSYQFDENQKHILGASVDFNIPFKAGPLNTIWSNSIGLGYTVGNKAPSAYYITGLDFTYPMHHIIALNFGLSQGITYNPDYAPYGDAFYFTESAWIGLPITFAKTKKFGDFVWKPYTSIVWNVDPDGVPHGIKHPDLLGPTLRAGHSFSFGRVDWIGNYRNGFDFSFNQIFAYNTYTSNNNFYVSSSFTAQFFKAFECLALSNRLYLFFNFGTTTEAGDRIRGVRDSYINTDSALLINFDMPIKVWQTDWVGYGLKKWTRYFDFELQLSPFFDMSIGHNMITGSNYNFKDGWYTTGLEIIAYPNKMRSIQGRISFGIDLAVIGKKIGEKSAGFNSFINKLFNTEWRTGSWYEFYFGLGLFY